MIHSASDEPLPTPGASSLHDGPWAGLPRDVLHDLLRLRVDVFVVEQECAYPELDGRDREPGTVHVWATSGDGPLPVDGCLRLLAEPDGTRRIGRVCVDRGARGRGLAADLVRHAIALAGDRATVLDAQAHLQGWYARLGYLPDGDPFVEDGIPHVPLRRPADPLPPR